MGGVVTTLETTGQFTALNQKIMACTLCTLAKTRNRAVPGEGHDHAEIMFVGEAPGSNEDQQGRPFVGRAGQFLDQLIDSVGLHRQDVFITNVVKCRPPNNRDPMPFELATCLPYLEQQIELIDPRVVVTLGRHSLGTFFPGELISRAHGTVRKKGERHFFAMYHPAAALHKERYRQTIMDDMRKLGQWLQSTREVQAVLDIPDQVLPDGEHHNGTQLSLF